MTNEDYAVFDEAGIDGSPARAENRTDRSQQPGVAGEYSRTQRFVESLGIGMFLSLVAYSSVQIAGTFSEPGNILLVLATLLGGALGADFLTGVVHWAADTWGRPTWPIVGNAFIRPFREHHSDPKAITRHDFVETNGANCLVSLPALVAAIFLFEPTTMRLALASSITCLCIWVFATNQFHKWAHQDAPPRLVRLLQRLGLVLSRGHHDTHHRHPFNNYYRITTGWLNRPLTYIRFFRRLEASITALTGAVPREDDLIRVRVVPRPSPRPPMPEVQPQPGRSAELAIAG